MSLLWRLLFSGPATTFPAVIRVVGETVTLCTRSRETCAAAGVVNEQVVS